MSADRPVRANTVVDLEGLDVTFQLPLVGNLRWRRYRGEPSALSTSTVTTADECLIRLTSIDDTDGGGGGSVAIAPTATPVEKSLLNDARIWYPVLAGRSSNPNVTEDEDDDTCFDFEIQDPEDPVR